MRRARSERGTFGALLKCTSSSATGEFTGRKSQALSAIALGGCKLGKTACASEGEPAGTVLTAPLRTTLGDIPGPHSFKGAGVGMLAEPVPGTMLAAFACGAQDGMLSGTFAAPVGKTDKMVAAVGWASKQKSGVPALTELIGLPVAALTLQVGEGEPQPAALAAKFSQGLEAEIEASDAKT